jgi:hypothetical protein
MPVRRCYQGGKPGYQYGKSGKCYTYTAGNESSQKAAKKKAHLQGAAVKSSQKGRGETPS